jgi:hypothetical protein
MNERDVDLKLGALLQRPEPEPDPDFVNRMVLAVRIDSQLALARQRSLRRGLVDCCAAAAVGLSFYLMSQMGGSADGGIILPGGPAMAGLVMMALWAAIALPVGRDRGLLGFAA